MRQRKFLYFVDGDDGLAYVPERASLEEYLDYVFAGMEGAGVDTLYYMVGIGALAPYPSKVLPKHGEAEDWNFHNGIASYRRHVTAQNFLEQGIDLPARVVEEAHRRNLEIFWDFRLNDIHDHWESSLDFLPTFKRDHPEWLNPREIFPDYEGNCEIHTSLNYLVSEVRRLKLRALEELLDRYDLDGVNLDFQRSQFYFRWDKGHSLSYVMTDFVRQTRRLLDAAGERRGRRLALSVRVCPTLEGSRCAGLDVARWAREGLVDLVTAGTGAVNFDIQGYREALAPYGVGFYPCLYGDYEKTESSDQVLRGVAETLLLGEPDGLYSFNLYPVERNRRKLLGEIGSLDRLRGLDKTYIADVNYDYNLCHEEWRYGVNLPIELTPTESEFASLTLRVGEDAARAARLTLKLLLWDYTGEDELEFRLNGEPLGAPRLCPVPGEYLQQWLCWDILGKTQLENLVEVRLLRRNPCLAKYSPLLLARANIELSFTEGGERE